MRTLSLLFLLVLFLLRPSPARADEPQKDDETPEKTEKPPKSVAVFSPIAGATKGGLFGVPVNRVSLGFEAGVRSLSSSLTFLGGFRIEPGQTENGLGAHRLELSATLMGGHWLRVGGGLHGAYAMITRVTEKDSFINALFGNIGGFGFGAHALLGVAVPLGPRTMEILARGTVDTYGSGMGWNIGPMLALRF